MAKTPNSRRGLGRGLEAIFEETARQSGGKTVLMLSAAELLPRTDQPRKTFELSALSSLADSIAAQGIIQPLIVRQREDGFYSIIAGERRWRAAKMAGLAELPCIAVEADEIEAAEMALIENIQREDLNPVEEADAYRVLLETGLKQEELARRVGRSRSAISNLIRLLDLPDETLNLLRRGLISEGHARALLPLRGDSEDGDEIDRLAQRIADEGLSVRSVEKLVKNILEKSAGKKQEADNESWQRYAREVSKRLSKRLDRRVRVTATKRSRRVIIDYKDNDDLENVIRLLTGGTGILDEEE
ncbi:MAG: ParB/RepB/Spo0J family partition protein [Clostridiales bacterium]|jgi:ParB family chromosome partitioning protein|nr:ParB/RepB/Spo0J family partition protein [Clostridiales bacterium]